MQTEGTHPAVVQRDSRPTPVPQSVSLSEEARVVMGAALADSTQACYRDWWQRFLDWGGTVPTHPHQVINYLTEHETSHAYSTLSRWTVAINLANQAAGAGKPCNTEEVRLALRGIARRQAERGFEERRVSPLLRDDVLHIIRSMGNELADVRDKAILLVGFVAAMRRSEIAALRTRHLSFTSQGVTIRIAKSKTDQSGRGHMIGVPFARGPVCAVRALREWLDELVLEPGEDALIFRKIDRWGTIYPPRPYQTTSGITVERGLWPRSIAQIIKKRCAAAGYESAEYSGHSLRAGFCTTSAMKGEAAWSIRKISRHKSDAMLERYIRDGRLYEGSPLDGMF